MDIRRLQQIVNFSESQEHLTKAMTKELVQALKPLVSITPEQVARAYSSGEWIDEREPDRLRAVAGVLEVAATSGALGSTISYDCLCFAAFLRGRAAQNRG